MQNINAKTEKTYCRTKNINMKNNEFKNAFIKISTCYYFGNIIEFGIIIFK